LAELVQCFLSHVIYLLLLKLLLQLLLFLLLLVLQFLVVLLLLQLLLEILLLAKGVGASGVEHVALLCLHALEILEVAVLFLLLDWLERRGCSLWAETRLFQIWALILRLSHQLLLILRRLLLILATLIITASTSLQLILLLLRLLQQIDEILQKEFSLIAVRV